MDSNQAPMDPLDVIVVGAGIAGLSAAIAIRRAGHNVTVYERSSLDNEFGAAINVCPNASRALLEWGLDPDGAKFVTAKTNYFADGQSLHRTFETEHHDTETKYGAPWYFAHRVDFHTELKRIATIEAGLGKPATLIPKSTVIGYDVEAGSITLANSTILAADLVIAADGIHSLATEAVLGYKNPALPTDQSILRFLIPTSQIAADPDTAHFLDGGDGCIRLFIGKENKRLVWYPCRNNEVQNFGCFFPDQEKDKEEDWNSPTDLNDLLSQLSEFHPSLLAVCRKATDIKKWPLLFRAPIPTWHKSKLVLIGDAAHPMLPHQGQAGAQAIEDSAALGIMLTGLTKTNIKNNNNLSTRLQLFEQVRINRASAMQIFSNAGQEKGANIAQAAGPYVKGKVPSNPAEFHAFNFGYDVVGHSVGVLRESEEGGDVKECLGG